MAPPVSFPTNRVTRGSIDDVVDYLAASGYQVNQGDFVLMTSGVCYSAANYGTTAGSAWLSGNEIQNWSGIRATTLGIAMGNNNFTDPRSGFVPVALTCTATYPIVATSGTPFKVGDFVSYTMGASTGNVSNSGYMNSQAVMVCSGQATAIGRILQTKVPVQSGPGLVDIWFQSPLTLGTIQNT